MLVDLGRCHHAGHRLAHRKPGRKEGSFPCRQKKTRRSRSASSKPSTPATSPCGSCGIWRRTTPRSTPASPSCWTRARSIAYHQRFVTAFPDISFEVLGVIAEGDRVLVQWAASGTHGRTAGHRHGGDHPPDPAAGYGVGCDGYRSEGRQDGTRLVLLGSARPSCPSWASPNSQGFSCPRRASSAVGSTFGGCGKRPRSAPRLPAARSTPKCKGRQAGPRPSRGCRRSGRDLRSWKGKTKTRAKR